MRCALRRRRHAGQLAGSIGRTSDSHALSRAWDNISPVPVTGVTGEARIADDLPDPSDTRAWTNSSSDTCGLFDWLSTSANFGASHAAGAIRPFRCVLGQ